MKISSIMTPDPITVQPECALERGIWLMGEHHLRHLPVVEMNRLIGVVSERDLLEATGWQPHRYLDHETQAQKTVRDYMSLPVETLSPDDELERAADRMLERRIGCMPVVEGEKVVGTVSESDLMRAYASKCAEEPGSETYDFPIAEFIDRELITVDADEALTAALELSHAERIRHLPVRGEGWFVGILSDRDIRLRIGRGELEKCTVGEAMTTDIMTLGPEDRLSQAAGVMLRERVSCVAVTRERRLVGIVTSTDVLDRCRAIEW